MTDYSENAREFIDDKSTSELLSSIWTKPSGTFRYILSNCPDRHLIVLMMMGGIVRGIDRAELNGSGDTMSLSFLLTVIVFGGILFGWMSYYIYAWAMRITGEWLGGSAKTWQFRTVLAWGSVPAIASLLLLPPQLIIFGESLFRSDVSYSGVLSLLTGCFGVLELILGLWSLFLLVKGIILIQEFSVGKALLNLILPGVLLIGCILILGLMISLLRT